MIRHVFVKLLRDPLMVFSLVNSSVSRPAEQIVIDETQALRLADQF